MSLSLEMQLARLADDSQDIEDFRSTMYQDFIGTNIYLVMNNFYNAGRKSGVISAFFSENRALKKLFELNGKDNYLIETKIGCLEEGHTKDEKAGRTLDNTDIKIIYFCLARFFYETFGVEIVIPEPEWMKQS